METFGERLKRIRKSKGMTQEMLANNFHYSKNTISQWEKNKTQPDIENLHNLSKILEVDLTYLIQGDNPTDADEFEKFANALKARGITESDLKKLSDKERRALYLLIEQLVNNSD